MLRFAAPVHVQIGHGESDKDGSVSHQHQAYDVTFVAGAGGRTGCGALRLLRRGAPDPADRAPAARPRAIPGRRHGRPATASGSCTPRPGRATGRASRTDRWPATGCRWCAALLSPTRRPDHLPAASADRHRRRAAHLAADREIRRLRPPATGTGSTRASTAGSGGSPTPASPTSRRWPTTGSRPGKPLVMTEPAASRATDRLAAAGGAAAAGRSRRPVTCVARLADGRSRPVLDTARCTTSVTWPTGQHASVRVGRSGAGRALTRATRTISAWTTKPDRSGWPDVLVPRQWQPQRPRRKSTSSSGASGFAAAASSCRATRRWAGRRTASTRRRPAAGR